MTAAPDDSGSARRHLHTDVLWFRVAQAVADLFVIGVGTVAVLVLVTAIGVGPLEEFLVLVVVVPWFVVNAVVPAVARGRTPGMALMGLAIVLNDGTRASFPVLLWRSVVLAFEYPFAVLSFLMIAFTRNHTRIADVLSNTLVIWVPPADPTP